jgi:uncharacterized phage protein gp47/JayE
MPQFGVTPTGFNAMTEADVLAAIEADQRAELSNTLDLSDSSVLGQTNRIYAKYIAEGWAALKAIHDGTDPNLAKDDQATSLSKITGNERRGAGNSHVDLTVTLTKGTKLSAGQHFAHVAGKPDLRWTPIVDFTAPADGSFTQRFQAEQPGPIDTPIDSITVIATPVVGWSGITGSGEVEIGRDADDDADLMTRREQGLARAGSGSVESIRSDLLALDAAVSAQVFENFTDFTDENGTPPHSFEAIVSAISATDDQIAQAVWNSKPAAIQPIGSSSGTALDAEGNPQVMRFSRTEQVEVYVSYVLTKLKDYVGDDAFREHIATRLDATLTPGESVISWDIVSSAHDQGVAVRGFGFGLTPNPPVSESFSQPDVPITSRQIARFDAGRIVLT